MCKEPSGTKIGDTLGHCRPADGPLGVNLARSNFINFVIALLARDNADSVTVGKV